MSKKGNPDFKPMSDEQREEVRLKRIADQEWAQANYKTEYADEQFWRDSASTFGLRLPHWWLPSSETKYVRRACKKLGLEVDEFVDSTGFSNLNQFVQNNPRLTALCMVGLVIEYKLSLES
jgi:hypothetical protein